MVELFQYYGDDFKYFYLKQYSKKDIASKATIFSCRFRKHRVKLLNTKKDTCHYLENVFESFVLLIYRNHFHRKLNNNNFKELSVFDTLELYTLLTECLNTRSISSEYNLNRFIEQKIGEKIDIPISLFNDFYYKPLLKVKLTDIDNCFDMYLNNKSESNIIVTSFSPFNNILIYTRKKNNKQRNYHDIYRIGIEEQKINHLKDISEKLSKLFNSELSKCEHCCNFFNSYCINKKKNMCYHCYYS